MAKVAFCCGRWHDYEKLYVKSPLAWCPGLAREALRARLDLRDGAGSAACAPGRAGLARETLRARLDLWDGTACATCAVETAETGTGSAACALFGAHRTLPCHAEQSVAG